MSRERLTSRLPPRQRRISKKSFGDKVVIITGGGAGIGHAAAIEFASQGARVMVTGRRTEQLQVLAGAYAHTRFTIADAASAEDALRTIRDAVDRYGRLDVLAIWLRIQRISRANGRRRQSA